MVQSAVSVRIYKKTNSESDRPAFIANGYSYRVVFVFGEAAAVFVGWPM